MSRTLAEIEQSISSSASGDGGDGRSFTFAELLDRAKDADIEAVPGILQDLRYLEDSGARNAQREAIFKQLKESTGAGLTALRSDYAAANQGESARPTISEQLLDLAFNAGVDPWHDPDGEPYITIPLDTHREHHRLKTQAVKRYLQRLWYEENGGTVGREPLSEVLGVLEGKAVHDGEEHPVNIRVAETGEGEETTVYIDMCDPARHVIEVTQAGWKIITSAEAPVRFVRTPGMLALPTPQPGAVTDLAAALGIPHLSEDGSPNRAFQGAVAWLLQAVRVGGPFPIMVLFGPQGAGKSNFTKNLCGLLDPHSATLRVLSRDDRDILISARNSWLQAKDNVSHLSQWTSDAFCRLATGGALSTRTLYSNDEETILNAKRPLLLNGITNFLEQQDLVDRALVVTLPSIPERDRLPESELNQRYEQAQPAALGALLDVVAAGIGRSSTRHLVRLPRMADFAEWIVACAPALAWDPEDFMTWYAGSKRDLMREALEASPIMPHLVTVVTDADGEWTGTASELLADLEDAAGLNEDGKKRRPKGWPTSARSVTAHLQRIIPALLEVERLEVFNTRAKSSRTWTLRSMGNQPSPPSPERWTREEGRPGRDSSGDGREQADRHRPSPPSPGDATVTVASGQPSPSEPRPARANDGGDGGDGQSPTLPVGEKRKVARGPSILEKRAAQRLRTLEGLPNEELARRLEELVAGIPLDRRPWWTNARSEPGTVATALELISEDSKGAAEMAAPLDYFKAARAAAQAKS